eukprot:UN00157
MNIKTKRDLLVCKMIQCASFVVTTLHDVLSTACYYPQSKHFWKTESYLALLHSVCFCLRLKSAIEMGNDITPKSTPRGTPPIR